MRNIKLQRVIRVAEKHLIFIFFTEKIKMIKFIKLIFDILFYLD